MKIVGHCPQCGYERPLLYLEKTPEKVKKTKKENESQSQPNPDDPV